MNVQAAYDTYLIMPQLSAHMRRVAGVGRLILDGWIGEVDRDLVIRTLLLHDMGNIVKFDLSDGGQKRVQSSDQSELPRWRSIQFDIRSRYGNDAHTATKGILSEMGADDVNEILDKEHDLYFSEASNDQLKHENPATMILLYADCRVIPSGVTSYAARLDDLDSRYGSKGPTWRAWMERFETYLQSQTTTQLTSITEDSVTPFMDEWLTYQL